ncbi:MULTISPECIES: DUF4166 domain-containing protein [Arthrobacter]|uniref:DUF4166 domain-containing protein n=1 Tax=Arthrobacter jinronghuae TaxID=2964609 RepID=A0ABT1NSD6_9MICC|nr:MULTISPECIES: DUF4166 domain-containing protein [Arthrobacter]MCQ1949466.1 DUF4166 domain-containing protein [Arthrobacter jinronghuae]MCQ1952786.1 DUF4166 domain-containing protein [Arthrobacter sp. zg-Y238]MCQ1955093.1 DUF4166 domain-containing protein [Arthrobacter jinronghuae]UWX77760.1 DUF4166 domain-containing protein [Arthrobacter jinronghuae]
MDSVYQQVLGSGFLRLQPQLQAYFSLGPDTGRFGEGTGVFLRAGCPRAWLRPLLPLVPVSNAFFPEYGTSVPFSIRNYPHLDPWGRPALTAVRRFDFPGRQRTFEDTTVLTGPGVLTDYLGRRRNLATNLLLRVSDDGHLHMNSPGSRLFLGPLRLPLPDFAGADAQVEQWWDAQQDQFRIRTRVIQRQVGTVFEYDGAFTYASRDFDGGLPADVEPARWERRT